MLEEYILTGDGKEYVDVNCVREALGIGKDSESDIFEWIAFLKKSNERSHSEMYAARGEKHEFEKKIREALGIVDEYADLIGLAKKLKEERDELKEKHDGLTADLELTHRLYKENHDFVDKVCEAVDIPRPYFESGYTNAAKLIAEIKRERDELKEKYDKLKKRTNAAYGVSCGYSGNKAPAFLCDVISYSWEFSPINACTLGGGPSYRVRDDSIRVELNLTPTANYKGSFDLEDLKKYIQEYGREKKLGIIESVDYQNAKAARAELAFLYKQVLGKEKLDRDLSPHEVMKAILDAVKKLIDAQFASDQCLRSVYMHIYEGTGYDISDIYAAPDKIAEWIITRYDSTKTLGHMETVCDINDFIDELCDKYNVVQPARSKTTRERIEYIFGVLAEHRDLSNNNFNKAEEFRKEKQAVKNVLAELRAKVREIYCSVVDDEWDEYFAYTSALNDINEEYKRVVHNFEKATDNWSNMSLQEFRDNVCEIFDIPSSNEYKRIIKELHDIADRYDELEGFRSDICGILDIESLTGTPQQNDKYILEQIEELKGDHCDAIIFRNDVAKAIGLTVKDCNSDIINRVMWIKDCHDKLARLRSNICTALCLGGETSDADILNAIAEDSKESNKLTVFRNDVAKAIGLPYIDINSDIINRVVQIKDCHDKLYKDYAKLHDDYVASQKQVKGFTNRCDSLENLQRDLWEFRRNAIEDLKSRGFFFRPEENETLPEIYDKLLKRYDWAYGEYKEQYRLRQQWHARYESEHERANGVQKALDREKAKCHVKDAALETAKKQYEKVCSNLETAECALNGMKSKVRELREEKTKVISAIGQDIWDECLK